MYYLFCLAVYHPYCHIWYLDLGNVRAGEDFICAPSSDSTFSKEKTGAQTDQ